MADVSQILRDLRDTEAAIERLRQQSLGMPEFEALEINLLSLEKREMSLREQFEEQAGSIQADICDYRIIPEIEDNYPIAAVGACLQRFQELFSIVFDSVKTQPKRRARISAEITEQSAFNFGYAYSGSLGFAFTIQDERLLLIESDVDRTAELFLSILKCQTPDQIRELVPIVGVAAISRAYELSKVHGNNAFNTRVQWRKGKEITHDVVIHAPEFDRLRAIIDETGEDQTDPVTLNGRLVGLDVDTSYFHIQFPEAEDIKGALADGFSRAEGLSVPGFYRADLIKTTRLHYSTGEEDENWTLVQLHPTGLLEGNESDLSA